MTSKLEADRRRLILRIITMILCYTGYRPPCPYYDDHQCRMQRPRESRVRLRCQWIVLELTITVYTCRYIQELDNTLHMTPDLGRSLEEASQPQAARIQVLTIDATKLGDAENLEPQKHLRSLPPSDTLSSFYLTNDFRDCRLFTWLASAPTG